MEKIISIKETTDDSNWGGYEGYEIKTDKQTIKLLISAYQQCCESWGYFLTEDKPSDFIGANLHNIKLTDACLNTKKLNESDYYHDDGDLMFVDLETDRGTLQFVAYNAHNGYYGHEAKVISEQLNHEEWL